MHMKQKRKMMMAVNVTGFLSGVAAGAIVACMCHKKHKEEQTLMSKAKKAFHNIEHAIRG